MGCRILAGLWAGVPKTVPPPQQTKESVQFYQTVNSRLVGQCSLSYTYNTSLGCDTEPYNWDGAYANGFPFQMRTNGNTSFGIGGLNWLMAFCG